MMEIDLKKISEPIDCELKEFKKKFRQAFKSKVALVELISGYILRQKGKKIRPILVLLTAKLCGSINERTYTGAGLVELLHTATLIHDDVVDDAKVRRGFPSINSIWKNKIAVLMGDYLLSRGMLYALENNEYNFLQITSRAVKRMSEGELLQIQKNRKLDLDEETYFRIIGEKTASLLSACCELGAASSTVEKDKISLMSGFGENIGIAFQLRDDILDYIGSANILGKDTGTDLKNKKFTLPLIYALRNVSKKEAKDILKIIKEKRSRKNKSYLLEFVKRNGGLDYTITKTNDYCQTALEQLSIFKTCEAKQSLEELVNFIRFRNN